MKLVGIDSSLSARKQLAAELHYSGDEKGLSRDEYLAPQRGNQEDR
jgi:Domain of unknown function (DUF3597)